MEANRKNTYVCQKDSDNCNEFLQHPISKETFVWAIAHLCQINQLPYDEALLLQQFSPPYSTTNVQLALKQLGLEINLLHRDNLFDASRQLPGLVLLLPEKNIKVDLASENEDAHLEKLNELGLLLRTDGERLLWIDTVSSTTHTARVDEAFARFQPIILTVRTVIDGEALPQDEVEAKKKIKNFGFRWFIPELLKYKKIWSEVVIASFIIQLIALATPLFTQVVIDKVIVHHAMNTLYAIGFGLLMFTVFTALITWIRQYLVLHTGNRVDAVLGSRVFDKLFNLPMRYFEHRPTGTLVARVQGIETIREFVSGAAVSLMLDLPFLVIFLSIMFYYNISLTVIVIVILMLIAILSLAITPTLKKRLNEQFQLGARNQAYVTEYLNGMETVKAMQMEPRLKQTYGGYLATYLQAGFKTRKLSNTYNVTANTLEQLQVLLILGVGAWLVMTTNEFTIGMLVAFQMFAGRLSQPVLRLVGLWQEFQQAAIAVKRLGDIMNAPSEPYALSPSRDKGGKGEVRIEGLGFRYSENNPWLYRDFNLHLKAGQCMAIMGKSGSGKSTLTKLMQGFYQATEGQLKVDNRDIRHLSANELRANFGIVPQETMLFSGTIYDNLILANPHATFEQVVQACKMADIHLAIEQMPKGYQQEIGEHGAGLSGGQKQRLAIARALLKRPRVLIFDEATSSLDSQKASNIAQTINQLKGKVSILFITHQMPKNLKVDQIVNLQ
jgi:subfamily B ATP-binding cassette protein HlyB/CyaB